MEKLRRMYGSPALLQYMHGKNKRNLVVEVASSNASDFEVTELYMRLVSDSMADYLLKKKRYRSFPLSAVPAGAESGSEEKKAAVSGSDREAGAASGIPSYRVLLPPYHLQIAEEVYFDIRKYWIFHKLTMKGIEL